MAIPIAAAFNVLLNERLLAHESAAGGDPIAAALSVPGSVAAGGSGSPGPDAEGDRGTGSPVPEPDVRGSGPRDRG
jgi:hypothetical protein